MLHIANFYQIKTGLLIHTRIFCTLLSFSCFFLCCFALYKHGFFYSFDFVPHRVLVPSLLLLLFAICMVIQENTICDRYQHLNNITLFTLRKHWIGSYLLNVNIGSLHKHWISTKHWAFKFFSSHARNIKIVR